MYLKNYAKIGNVLMFYDIFVKELRVTFSENNETRLFMRLTPAGEMFMSGPNGKFWRDQDWPEWRKKTQTQPETRNDQSGFTP